MNNVFVSIAALAVVFSTFGMGVIYGQRTQQSTIVEECKREGVYLDRRLLIQCRVNEPMEQRGSTS